MARSKNIQKILIWIILGVGLLSVIGIGVYIYRLKVKSNSYFLQVLSEYEVSSDEVFQENWTKMVAKARTSFHYLMLLKRLDERNLYEEYKNTLVRALWKYPKVQSFSALTIDYMLNYGEHSLFESALLNKDELWNIYPNLLRLYYIDEYERLESKYTIDEILQIYYKIQEQRDTWNTWYTLWQLTKEKEPIFLYIAGIRAMLEGDEETSRRLYDALPLDWKNIYSEYYMDYAWLIKDVKTLRTSVYATRDSNQYVKLAGVYSLIGDREEAYNVLNNYRELFPTEELPSQFVELLVWLEQQLYKDHDLLKLGELVYSLEDIEVYRKYIARLFSIDYKLVQEYYQSYQGESFADEILGDDIVTFIEMNTHQVKPETLQALLWRMVNKYHNVSNSREYLYWVHMAAIYFLSHDLLEDYLLLEKKGGDQMKTALFPYHVYNTITQNRIVSFDILHKKTINYDSQKFAWWYYYNLGLWSMNVNEYTYAEEHLLRALSLIDATTQKYQYLILSQLVCLYLYKEDILQADIYFEQLDTLFPANPYKNEIDRLYIAYKESSSSIELEEPPNSDFSSQ